MTALAVESRPASPGLSAVPDPEPPAPDPEPLPHRWAAAAEVVLSAREVAGVARRQEVQREGTVRIDVLDVYCRRCRRSFRDARHSPCDPDSTLYGGPLKRRTASERDLADL